MSHLLEVKDLTIAFTEDKGTAISADHINFTVDAGETVCIVGESGCGKSVTSLAVMGLLGRDGQIKSGEVIFEGQNLLTMTEKELDKVRGNRMSMIFQDPLTSLNPAFRVESQMIESIRIHMGLPKEAAKQRAVMLLQKVGMPDAEAVMKRYPHTLSGGMRQRVMIAMALACNPALLIADEPTTALDVTIQAQIMMLLKELQKELGMAMILITHDMGVVAHMADRVLVMYAGQIIERALGKELFVNPGHPYTKALLNSIPHIGTSGKEKLFSIQGRVPERYGEMTGCRFAQRCAYRREECKEEQKDYELTPGHCVRCIVRKEGGTFQ